MRFGTLGVALLAGVLSAAYALIPLQTESLSLGGQHISPGPFRCRLPGSLRKNSNTECNGRNDCCKDELCFRCPFCDNQFNRPGSCLPLNGPIPGCAPPPPCDAVCPAKECSSNQDCCPTQTCAKCPACPGALSSGGQSKGTCVSETGLVTEPNCKPCVVPSPPPPPSPPTPPSPPSNNECESGADCPEGTICNRCPRCEGPNGSVFSGPGFCTRFPTPCAAPPPCETVCPSKDCTSDNDCCSGQTCSKCPTCPGVLTSRVQSKGTCVSKTGLSAKPRCEPCGPPPNNKCESASQCPKGFFCNRCPRCEGPNGLEFDGPGTCGRFIISCAAPSPCGGLLFP